MRLTRERIVEAAYLVLREQGLVGLSMRNLANELGVQPGGLYYYVASKQELLALVVERIFRATRAGWVADTEPREAARQVRDVLLPIRDGAEVVSFVRAFKQSDDVPLGEVETMFGGQFRPRQARWAAQTLIHFVLGFVAEEQNRVELVKAHVLADGPDRNTEAAFLFGVDAILAGLTLAGHR